MRKILLVAIYWLAVSMAEVDAQILNNAIRLRGRIISPTVPTDGQALVWDAATSRWKPGLVSLQSLAVPGAPSVTPTCAAACTETWTYVIVAKLADGTTTEAGAAGSTAVQNATLSGTNFNVLTWTAVTGASSYDVRRTVSGGTPATLGIIASVTAATYTDTGAAGDASASPTVNATGNLLWATDSRGDIGASSGNRPMNLWLAGTVTASGSLIGGLAAPTVSASTVTLPAGNVLHITGTTNIDTINTCNAANQGRHVVLIFDGILTVNDASNLKLTAAFVTTADDTLSLMCDGTSWFETARSIN